MVPSALRVILASDLAMLGNQFELAANVHRLNGDQAIAFRDQIGQDRLDLIWRNLPQEPLGEEGGTVVR